MARSMITDPLEYEGQFDEQEGASCSGSGDPVANLCDGVQHYD